jgi:hypothetical protein
VVLPDEPLPDGLVIVIVVVVVVKRDCPTCMLVAPVLGELARRTSLTVYSQDDPVFPTEVSGPGWSMTARRRCPTASTLVTVPTLLRVEHGVEVDCREGWLREQWEELTGIAGLGADLPEYRPGCGSRTLDPGRGRGARDPATAAAGCAPGRTRAG